MMYRTSLTSWRAAEHTFHLWELSGITLASDDTLQIDPINARPGCDPYGSGGYQGNHFYNGGTFIIGEAMSPPTAPGVDFAQAIVSVNADTLPGTWIEPLIRIQVNADWTHWHSLGVWAADDTTIERHSVATQEDDLCFVAVDTLILRDARLSAQRCQIKLRLFSVDGLVTPIIRNVAVACAPTPPQNYNRTSTPLRRQSYQLPVPQWSQMGYPNGNLLCSPVCVAMVLAYWDQHPGPYDSYVYAAVDGVFDWHYEGHGNWLFNIAYAGTHNMESYVTRFPSLTHSEAWLEAGVPIVIALAWNTGELTGAPIAASEGHLAVLIGFDAVGNPLVNDPAAATHDVVQRTYRRDEIEALWLKYSGGTAYLIFPSGYPVPCF